VQTLDTELRKVDKAESAVLWLAAAVSFLSAIFLIYAASQGIWGPQSVQTDPLERGAKTAQL
jgi:hypothetical protein